MFENLCECLEDELMEMDRRTKAGEKLSPSDIQFGDIVAHFAKCMATYAAMKEPGYSNRGYSRGDAYPANWDAMGRGYSYRDEPRGYSRAGDMAEMEHMISGAMPRMDEETRRDAQRLLDRMRR